MPGKVQFCREFLLVLNSDTFCKRRKFRNGVHSEHMTVMRFEASFRDCLVVRTVEENG